MLYYLALPNADRSGSGFPLQDLLRINLATKKEATVDTSHISELRKGVSVSTKFRLLANLSKSRHTRSCNFHFSRVLSQTHCTFWWRWEICILSLIVCGKRLPRLHSLTRSMYLSLIVC